MNYGRVTTCPLSTPLLFMTSSAHAIDQSGVLKATDLMKMKVEGTDGKSLGHIRDLVIDPEDGDIDYAVLDFGGIAGLGDKYFTVLREVL